MGAISRLHRVIFSSGNNPRSTIEFVENRGINLFEGFGEDRKQFNPMKGETDEDRETDDEGVYEGLFHTTSEWQSAIRHIRMIDFNLPVLVGGRNGSGKTSLLRAIKIVCDLLQEPEISESDASKAWLDLDEMNISHLSLLFSRIIPGLTDEKKLSFTESVTKIVMDSTDPDEILKWCDGIQIRNPNFNISESIMYHKFDEFRPAFQGKMLPEYKTTIGEPRIKKFLINLSERTDGASDEIHSLSPSELNKEVNDVLSRLESTEYTQQEIHFQEAMNLLDVDRELVQEKFELMKKFVNKVAKQYDKLTRNPEFIQKELSKITPGAWFSLIYGEAKNVIEEAEDGEWDMTMYAPNIIEGLQYPYIGYKITPDWFRRSGKWRNKQDAMNYVTEGALLDFTSWLTGIPQLGRSFRYGERGLEWIDTLLDQEWKGGVRKYEVKKGRRGRQKLHAALKNPVFRKLLDIDQPDDESVAQIDIITRMDFFTPIQEITTSYLTSGQKQLLSLIIAVRESKEGSLILIDEPEISLHVDWQVDLVEQLHAPLSGSQLVIATHSPDIALNHNDLCSIISTEPKEIHQGD